MSSYIRFDWAMKNILQYSSNYEILEGLFSVVLNQPIKIFNIFRNIQGNEEEFDNPYRIDVMATNAQKEIIIIELQHHNEKAYFERVIFGTSNFITECVNSKIDCPFVSHIYCINVVHFPLMPSKEKVFCGKRELKAAGSQELLSHSPFTRQNFDISEDFYLYPEYHILCVYGFKEWTKNPLEQWIYYLNTGEIPDSTNTPGLTEVKRYLNMDWFNESEMKSYYRHLEDLAILNDNISTGRVEGRVEERWENARKMKSIGLSQDVIQQVTGLTIDNLELL